MWREVSDVLFRLFHSCITQSFLNSAVELTWFCFLFWDEEMKQTNTVTSVSWFEWLHIDQSEPGTHSVITSVNFLNTVNTLKFPLTWTDTMFYKDFIAERFLEIFPTSVLKIKWRFLFCVWFFVFVLNVLWKQQQITGELKFTVSNLLWNIFHKVTDVVDVCSVWSFSPLRSA